MLFLTVPLNSGINFAQQPPGLLIFRDFLTEDEEVFLINFIDNELDNSGLFLKKYYIDFWFS